MRTRTKIGVTLAAGAMAVLGMAGPTSASTELQSTIATQAQKAGLSKSEVADLQRQIDKQMATTPADSRSASTRSRGATARPS